MIVPLDALNASPRRDPVAGVASVPLRPDLADRVREAKAADPETKAAVTSSAQVNSAVEDINQALKLAAIGVQFEFDKEADTMITKVVDVETGDVIRQMPSEEVVRFSKAAGKLQGLLVSQKV